MLPHLAHLRWPNAKPLRLGEFPLALVESVEHIGAENERGGHVQKVERPGTELGAMPARKNQRLLPDFGHERLDAKDAGTHVLQELLAYQPSLTPRPLLSEDLQLKGVCKFCFAKGREQKDGPRTHQPSRYSGMIIPAVERNQEPSIRICDQ